MIYPDGMRKLFKSCGSWNPDSFQITPFQVRTCVLCGWFESMLALKQKSIFESSFLSLLYERMWMTQTPNHHNWWNRRIAKKEQGRLLLKLYEKRIQYFVWKN